jgi:hypothetical protein
MCWVNFSFMGNFVPPPPLLFWLGRLCYQELGMFATNLFLLDWLENSLGRGDSNRKDKLFERPDLRQKTEELHTTFKALLSCVKPTPGMLSPKVVKLLEVLREYRDVVDFSAIVFVKVRHHCSIISNIIARVDDLNFIRSKHLVGHGTGDSGNMMMIMAAKAVRRKSALFWQ